MMPTQVAKVRVYLCTYRRPSVLPRALASLCNQTFKDWVCELHNDDPADSNPATLVKELGDSRITIVNHERNLGPVSTFNLIFNPCPNLYVGLLEDDNWWEPEFLQTMVDEMDAHPLITVGWSNMHIIAEGADGVWSDTTRTVWPWAETDVVRLFKWPQISQSWQALHSNGSMLVRAGNLEILKIPETTRFDFSEQVRERAMPHPLLFLPKPLANFSVTLSSARLDQRVGISEHQIMLLSSFLHASKSGVGTITEIWRDVRKSKVRSTDMLILTGIYDSRCRAILRHARPSEWFGFFRAQFRHPILFLHAMRSRRRYPELWRFLNVNTLRRFEENDAHQGTQS